MRRIGLLCVTVLLFGGLAGCGNRHSSNASSSSKISKLKAENSSLKAKRHHHKHHKTLTSSGNQVSKASNSANNSKIANNSSKGDAKEAQARKALHDYDPEWWDSLSPDEQAYWAHHTAYVDNEDFMYEPNLYARHYSPQPADGGNQDNSYVDYSGDNYDQDNNNNYFPDAQ